MTMFADCREKFMKDAYPYGGPKGRENTDNLEGEINPYWDGNLNDDNKYCVFGFDTAAEMADGTFANDLSSYIDDYWEEYFEERFGKLDKLNIDDDVLGERKCIDDYTEEEISKWSKATALLMIAKEVLLDTLEMERNELVTGLIDSQDDDE